MCPTGRAAERGHAKAQFALGYLYYNGQGVPQDYPEAAQWYRRAAEQGHPEAQGALGALYAQGHGVPQDAVQAHVWVNLAAAHLPSGSLRDGAVVLRDGVAKHLNAWCELAKSLKSKGGF